MEQRVKAYNGTGPYAFVSYSHNESGIVYPIIEQLVNMGYNIWYDQGIPLIADYGGELYRQIKDCTVFVLFASKASAESKDVKKEIIHAISFQKNIVQVAIDKNVKYPDEVAYHLPPTLQYLSMDTEPSEFYEKLTETLAECRDDKVIDHGIDESGAKISTLKARIHHKISKLKSAFSGSFLAVATLVALLAILMSAVAIVVSTINNANSNNDDDDSKITQSSQHDNPPVVTPEVETGGTAEVETDDTPETIAPERIETPRVGSYVTFGSYEQDGNHSNGQEPIEWLVLDVLNDGSALLISEYALDCVPYNENNSSVTWETCTLRDWLNNEFFNSAFSPDEQQRIQERTLSNSNNGYYGTGGGKGTRDKVFCLSIDEVRKYFSDDNDRECKPTDYTATKNTLIYKGICWWWLRSPGNNNFSAAAVTYHGAISSYGELVKNGRTGVRPVILVQFSD